MTASNDKLIEDAVERIVNQLFALLGAVYLLCSLVNLWVLVFGTADNFQRLGAFWVAVSIWLYGMAKMISRLADRVAADPKVIVDEKLIVGSTWWNSRTGVSKDNYEIIGTLEGQNQFRKLLKIARGRAQINFYSGELTFLSVATLQWGYGDKFFSLVHGSGWT